MEDTVATVVPAIFCTLLSSSEQIVGKIWIVCVWLGVCFFILLAEIKSEGVLAYTSLTGSKLWQKMLLDSRTSV